MSETIHLFDRVGNAVQQRELIRDNGDTPTYRQTEFVFDGLRRLIAQIAPTSEDSTDRPTTHFVYDAVGNLRFQQDAVGTWTEFQFDALGRMVTVIESGTEDHASPVTRMEYTVANELAAIVDPLGRRTEFEYDDLGRLVAERMSSTVGQADDLLPEVIYEYDLHGNPVLVMDGDGNSQHVTYDALDRVVLVTENGETTQRQYDALGRLASETDPLGATTRYGYDLLGRRTITSPPQPDGGESLSRTLDDEQADLTGSWNEGPDGWKGSHQFAEVTDDSEPTASWSVTGLSPGTTYEVLATWSPEAANVEQAMFHLLTDDEPLVAPVVVDQRQISSDVVDGSQTWQRLAVVNVLDDSMEVLLDAPGASGVLVADGVWIVEVFGNTYTSYDMRGNVLAESDGLGNTRRYTYDTNSHRTSVTDANGDATLIDYDLVGRVLAISDPQGNTTSYAYDHMDRVITEWVQHDGESVATWYQYDAKGNLEEVVDRMGRVRGMRYDVLGRLKEEVWYATAGDAQDDVGRLNTIEHSYDAAGRRVAVSDNASRYEFLLDGLDRPLLTTADVVAVPPVTLRYEYSRQDDLRDALRVSVSGQEDHANSYSYDDRSRLVRIEQSGTAATDKRVDFAYTQASALSDVRRFAALDNMTLVAHSNYQYDSQGRLLSLTHDQLENVFAEYQWVFDAANRVVQESTQDGIAQYQYDARGQLLSADYDYQADESHRYDANGNRIDTGYVVGNRNLIESDGLFQYEYDAQGNRTRRVERATGKITEYQWDVRNQLVKIVELDGDDGPVTRSVEYVYDVLGRRIQKKITPAVGPAEVESYVYDDQDIVLRFTAGNLANRYLHGPLVDQVLADEQCDGEGHSKRVLWPLPDHLGTVNDLLEFDSSSGLASVVNHITYDAFGGVTGETEAAVDHLFGFTGRESDAESDLYYYRARYYDPQMGQFISEDPAGFAAGDANLRRYVENDPTNQVDPTGMYGDDVHFYFNYYLARYLGLDQPSGWINSKGQPVSEAYIIAYFATRIDYDGVTRPVGGGVGARSRFHFPDPGGPSKPVQRNDGRVRAALHAVGSTGDVEMFGLLLHVYQDSYAHEKHHKTTGHLTSSKPDKPYLHPTRDRQMAQRAYNEMVNLLLVRRGVAGGVSSPQARALLRGRSFAAFWNQAAGRDAAAATHCKTYKSLREPRHLLAAANRQRFQERQTSFYEYQDVNLRPVVTTVPPGRREGARMVHQIVQS